MLQVVMINRQTMTIILLIQKLYAKGFLVKIYKEIK